MKLPRARRSAKKPAAAVPVAAAPAAEVLEVCAMALAMPVVDGHPNRHPFEGCLTLVDVASDRAPSGARGHRVILTRAAAVAALPSLLGMAVDFTTRWDGHDARRKCGILTAARLEADRLMVSGFVFGRDWPEIAEQAESKDLGMSYVLANAHVDDMRAAIWVLNRATFTGAAILLRAKAAYRETSFRLLDRRQDRTASRAERETDGSDEPVGELVELRATGAERW